MHLIMEFHLASKYKNVFPTAIKKTKKQKNPVFLKNSSFQISDCEYLRTSRPISKARKVMLWLALQECMEAEKGAAELLLPQSPFRNNTPNPLLGSTTCSSMACDMCQLEQKMLTAHFLNPIIWAWKLHKANIFHHLTGSVTLGSLNPLEAASSLPMPAAGAQSLIYLCISGSIMLATYSERAWLQLAKSSSSHYFSLSKTLCILLVFRLD